MALHLGNSNKLKINSGSTLCTLTVPSNDRYVTFMNGNTVLCICTVKVGNNCPNVAVNGLIGTPTKQSTVQYDYTFAGWSLTDGGEADASALSTIINDRVVYAAYTASVRKYTVNFYDEDTLLQSMKVEYGSMPIVDNPTKDDYTFVTWQPELTTVVGDISYYAQWKEKISFASSSWTDIATISEAGEAANYFAIGDTRKEIIDGKQVTLMIVDFNADLLASGGTAGMTIMPTDVTLCRTDKIGCDYDSKYIDCTMKTKTEEMFNAMSEELRNVIKTVVKKYNSNVSSSTYTQATYQAKVWQPSYGEIGNGTYYTYQDRYLNRSYQAFINDKKLYQLNCSAQKWYWTRTNQLGKYQYYVTGGYSGWNYGYSSNSNYLLYGFCV